MFIEKWKEAALQEGVDIVNGHLLQMPFGYKLFGQPAEFSFVIFRQERFTNKDWASTAMMVDGFVSLPEVEAVQRHVFLSSEGIREDDWRTRYPDIDYSLAYRFVLQHELGHVMHGSSESKADKHAFEVLKLKANPSAEEMREVRYSATKEKFLNL